ncbi:MAG: exo-alpha-sialidase [Acidobacteria bacterium]|nr:exo-alpha-sialidase [Acidobacteriota bacterium]
MRARLKPLPLLIAGSLTALTIWLIRPTAPHSVLAADAERARYLIQFGVDGKENVDWSGSLTAPQAKLSAWQFDPAADSLTANTWKAATKREVYWDTPYERIMGPTANREKVTAKGLWVELGAPVAEIRVTTKQGDFVFEPTMTPGDAPQRFLDGRVAVQAVPAGHSLTKDAAVEDYPSMIETRDGTLWMAYQRYENDRDQIVVRKLVKGAWTNPEPVSAPCDCYKTALAQDRLGRIWVVWSEQQNGNFDLYARAFDGKAWSKSERITNSPNSDINHVMASDAAGNIYLAWQSARNGNFDIYFRVLREGKWGPEIAVSTDPANDWEPTVAIAPNGAVAVLWDTYANGNYDIAMRTYFRGQFGPPVPIVTSEAFEARPVAKFDAQSRLWIAWDDGDSAWGKDYGYQIGDRGRGLLLRRQSRVAVWEGGRLQAPLFPETALPEDLRQVAHQPNFVLDAAGNPWLFFHVRVNLPRQRGGQETYRAMWRIYATTLRGDKWTPAMELAEGYGRIDMPVAAAARKNGEVAVAWASDGRTWPAGHPAEHDLHVAMIPKAAPTMPAILAPYFAMRERRPPIHQQEAADVARMRNYRAKIDGKEWRIVRGDIHRHTDLSWDGNRDGSLDDSYRYALDAVAFDYQGVCDHQAGQSIPYNWWRIQKAVDLYTIAGKFVPVYSYERSLPWPNGHRNVVFAERGRPLLEIPEAERRGQEGAGKLYAYLRQFSGVTTSHTSASGMGTDFRDRDPEVEPVVEIYQGYRSNYEATDAPRAPSRGEVTRYSLGFVSSAWARGIKMGVQASSDHVSTHISYANFWVSALDRKEIIAAMKARRSFASTDNIIVDLRAAGHFMGEAFAAATPPSLHAVVNGTGPLKQVDVIRSNKVVYTVPGSGSEAKFTFTDREKPEGEVFYYIRALQQDGQLAWSSPIWVKYN